MASLRERFETDRDRLTELPALPPVVIRLIATMSRDDTGLAEIAKIVRHEPVLVAKVLHAANSAFYAGRAPATTIEDAMRRLGLVTIRRLALVMSLRGLAGSGTWAARTQFWFHSLCVAQAAALVTRRSRNVPEDFDGETLFLTGLLHDLGLLVLGTHYPRELASATALAEGEGIPLWQAEQRLLGSDHAELGAVLAASWSLPDEICAPIRAHHQPASAPDQFWSARVLNLVDRVFRASGLADATAPEPEPGEWGAVGIAIDTVPAVLVEIMDEAEQASALITLMTS